MTLIQKLADDLLHAFSGVWALAAAFISHRQAVFYFKLGSVYLFDRVLGLITGSGCLGAGIDHLATA
jgi:hypothetical protein